MALSILSPDSLDLTQDFAGIHLGGTGSANQLDDYETGTWTPSYIGLTTDPTCTYDKQVGFYTKIGTLVNIFGRIRTDSASGGSGILRIAGLPFTVNNVSDGYGIFTVGYVNAWPSLSAPNGGYLSQNTTQIALSRYNSSDARNAFATTLSTSDLNTGTNKNDIIFKATYSTD